MPTTLAWLHARDSADIWLPVATEPVFDNAARSAVRRPAYMCGLTLRKAALVVAVALAWRWRWRWR